MKKKALIIVLVAVIVCIFILVIDTVRFRSKQIHIDAVAPLKLETGIVAERLGNAIRLKTVSADKQSEAHHEEFLKFHDYLESVFPLVHKTLQKQVFSDYSLLYTWNGLKKDVDPILFISHLDVVPVDPETEGKWTHPPFSGKVADGFIWGRGALDVKGGLMALLEAIEHLVRDGYQPVYSIYVAFSHDEERFDSNSAATIAEYLSSEGITFSYAFDEGGFTVQNVFPGVKHPIALVGISEKGYLSLELRVEGEEGHVSIPPDRTAIDILADAISRLGKSTFKARLDGATAEMFEFVGPEMSPVLKTVFAHQWLFESPVKRILSKSNKTNALIRTTKAVSFITGGGKENVVPSSAMAVVNIRILPGDRVQDTVEYVRNIVNDSQVEVNVKGTPSEAAPIADINSAGFRAIARAIRQITGKDETIVAPYLTPGATDSRNFSSMVKNTYRFASSLYPEDVDSIHGVNERISVRGYVSMINFYYRLIQNLNEMNRI